MSLIEKRRAAGDKIRCFTTFSKAPTLRQVWSDYQYQKRLSESTLRIYNCRLDTHLSDWLDLPVRNITPEMIIERHATIHGASMADSTMRTLRALFTHAQVRYEEAGKVLFPKHLPTKVLNKSRKWNGDRVRTSYLNQNQLRSLLHGLPTVDFNTMRALVLFLLFTGLKKNQALGLKWSDVNFVRYSVNIADSEIPLSTQAMQSLVALKGKSESAFVFANRWGTKPITGANKSVDLIGSACGVRFCLDDLRRTFLKVAENVNTSESVLTQLLNRAPKKGDTVHSLERLRASAQRIADAIEASC